MQLREASSQQGWPGIVWSILNLYIAYIRTNHATYIIYAHYSCYLHYISTLLMLLTFYIRTTHATYIVYPHYSCCLHYISALLMLLTLYIRTTHATYIFNTACDSPHVHFPDFAFQHLKLDQFVLTLSAGKCMTPCKCCRRYARPGEKQASATRTLHTWPPTAQHLVACNVCPHFHPLECTTT